VSNLEIAELIKSQNVIDMALTFTAMVRLFSKGSKNSIAKKFEDFCANLKNIESASSYEKFHESFCKWFSENVQTAQKILKNKETKQSASASYGQGAKVLDIAIKVYVHYCKLPDPQTAERILPFLHGAIDTPIMKHLKQRYPRANITASTIKAIDQQAYRTLQELIACDIKDNFQSNIHPVHYDDIMWNRLNRSA
jgi:DNA primase